MRMTLEFDRVSKKKIDALADEFDTTRLEVIKLALGLFYTVTAEIRKGNKLMIADSNDKIIKELVIPKHINTGG